MLTATQTQTAQSIVNLFETSAVLGDYGNVTVVAGDTGHLTFGRSQTTLGSGNLHDLLNRYCSNPGARFGKRLALWMPRFEATDLSLDDDTRLHNTLRATADDKVMRDTQDVFFNEVYWQPAQRAATALGITSPLGVAAVYDSTVHGSWRALRDRTNQQAGTVAALGEQAWVTAYVAHRRQWLDADPCADLPKTVYPMDAFQRLIDQGFWGLELPLVVRGAGISLATLCATPPGCYDRPQLGTRRLSLQSKLVRGLDGRLVQLGLSDRGADIKADDVFAQTSAKRLAEYQQANGLPAAGVPEHAPGRATGGRSDDAMKTRRPNYRRFEVRGQAISALPPQLSRALSLGSFAKCVPQGKRQPFSVGVPMPGLFTCVSGSIYRVSGTVHGRRKQAGQAGERFAACDKDLPCHNFVTAVSNSDAGASQLDSVNDARPLLGPPPYRTFRI